MLSILFFLLQGTRFVMSGVSFYPPKAGGGSNLDLVTTNNLREPINVIISGQSSSPILQLAGLDNYMKSLGLSDECLGQHGGSDQLADLGDGNGLVKQIKVYRQDFGNSHVGTCLETFLGGNHARVWQQTGSKAPSFAWFLAVSHEENILKDHTISADGYNLGRFQLVKNATQFPTTSFGSTTYKSTVTYVSGLLDAGSASINHGISQDGQVAVLTVNIIE